MNGLGATFIPTRLVGLVIAQAVNHWLISPASSNDLEAYRAEFEFRFNNGAEHLFRSTLTRPVTAENLPYSKLISLRLLTP
jgi:hypothetical protein